MGKKKKIPDFEFENLNKNEEKNMNSKKKQIFNAWKKLHLKKKREITKICRALDLYERKIMKKALEIFKENARKKKKI